MKKKLWYSWLFIACLAPLALRAQLQKGTIMTRPVVAVSDINLSNLLPASQGGFSMSLSPGLGVFLSDRFVLGGGISLSMLTTGRGLDDAFALLGIGTYGRYYFNPKSANNHFYTNLAGGVVIPNEALLSITEDRTGWLTSLGVGMTRFVGAGTAVDFDLAYTYNSGSIFDNNWGVSLRSGINLMLNPETRAGARAAKSAFQRGSIMLGMDANRLEASLNERGNVFVFSPRIGFFTSSRMVLGANLSAGIIENKIQISANEFTTNVTSAALSPYARYYFGQAKHTLWYAELGGGFGIIRLKSSFFNQTDTNFTLNGAAEGGINVFISPVLALEAGVRAVYGQEAELTQFNLQPKLGFNCFINRQAKND